MEAGRAGRCRAWCLRVCVIGQGPARVSEGSANGGQIRSPIYYYSSDADPSHASHPRQPRALAELPRDAGTVLPYLLELTIHTVYHAGAMLRTVLLDEERCTSCRVLHHQLLTEYIVPYVVEYLAACWRQPANSNPLGSDRWPNVADCSFVRCYDYYSVILLHCHILRIVQIVQTRLRYWNKRPAKSVSQCAAVAGYIDNVLRSLHAASSLSLPHALLADHRGHPGYEVTITP